MRALRPLWSVWQLRQACPASCARGGPSLPRMSAPMSLWQAMQRSFWAARSKRTWHCVQSSSHLAWPAIRSPGRSTDSRFCAAAGPQHRASTQCPACQRANLSSRISRHERPPHGPRRWRQQHHEGQVGHVPQREQAVEQAEVRHAQTRRRSSAAAAARARRRVARSGRAPSPSVAARPAQRQQPGRQRRCTRQRRKGTPAGLQGQAGPCGGSSLLEGPQACFDLGREGQPNAPRRRPGRLRSCCRLAWPPCSRGCTRTNRKRPDHAAGHHDHHAEQRHAGVERADAERGMHQDQPRPERCRRSCASRTSASPPARCASRRYLRAGYSNSTSISTPPTTPSQ
jgi:hypothetical protein